MDVATVVSDKDVFVSATGFHGQPSEAAGNSADERGAV